MDEWELGKGWGGSGATFLWIHALHVRSLQSTGALWGVKIPDPTPDLLYWDSGRCFHRLVGPEVCVSFKRALGYFLGNCCTRAMGLRRSCARESPGELAPNADFGLDSVGLRWDIGIDLTNRSPR